MYYRYLLSSHVHFLVAACIVAGSQIGACASTSPTGDDSEIAKLNAHLKAHSGNIHAHMDLVRFYLARREDHEQDVIEQLNTICQLLSPDQLRLPTQIVRSDHLSSLNQEDPLHAITQCYQMLYSYETSEIVFTIASKQLPTDRLNYCRTPARLRFHDAFKKLSVDHRNAVHTLRQHITVYRCLGEFGLAKKAYLQLRIICPSACEVIKEQDILLVTPAHDSSRRLAGKYSHHASDRFEKVRKLIFSGGSDQE